MPNISSHPLADKHIIIAGAGIAGLSFARALHQKWPSDSTAPRVTIYERREKQTSIDTEGYSLSVRSDAMSGGLQALRELNLLDETIAASFTAQHGGWGGLWDVNWKQIMAFKLPATPPDGLPCHHLRVARNRLRQLLIDGLPTGSRVQWGLGCSSAETQPDGTMKVTLSDGTTATCDLLIAADGASSRIRAALRPDDKLQFTGAVLIAATARFSDRPPAPMNHDWGMTLGGGGHAVFAAPIDEHSAVWSLSYIAPEPREKVSGPAAVAAADQILAEVRERGKVFAEPFETLVEATDRSTLMVFNGMDKPPVAHRELPDTPVVFIGDASHAVSPFAGNGANMAMMDGVQLAEELCRDGSRDIRTAIAAFDDRSIPRCKTAVNASHFTIMVGHSSGWRLFAWMCLLRLMKFFNIF